MLRAILKTKPMKIKEKIIHGQYRLKLKQSNVIERLMVFTLKIIGWLSSLYKERNQVVLKLHSLATTLTIRAKSRGVVGLILYLKDLRLALLIFLSGEYPVKVVPGIKVTRDGFPLALGLLEGEIRDSMKPDHDKLVLRLLLTLLFSTRALNKGKVPDVSPITAAFTGSLAMVEPWIPYF